MTGKEEMFDIFYDKSYMAWHFLASLFLSQENQNMILYFFEKSME